MFTVIMKELLAGNSFRMKAYSKLSPPCGFHNFYEGEPESKVQ